MINGFENLDTYNRVLVAAFNEALPLGEVPFRQFTMEVPSSAKTNDYAGLFEVPTVREWLGDRVVHEIKGQTYSITNKLWELSVSMRRADVEDDEEAAIAMTSMKVRAMAQESNDHPGRKVFELLREGKSNNGYDGKPFFGTTHLKNGGTQANLDAGGSAPWYLLDTSKSIKPMLLQMRKRPELQSPQMTDESVRMRDELIWTTRARYNVGYGLWQTAYRSEEDLTEDNFQAAMQAMTSFEDAHGRYLGIMPNLLVVPPSLRTKALKLLASTTTQGGENINAGAVGLLITPWVIE